MRGQTQKGAVIVYDGQCPFCSTYVSMLRLRDSVGAVQLIDARSADPVVSELQDKGYDLDEGMVLLYGGRIYYGADCVNRLALLTTQSGFFNRISASVFRNESLSRQISPVLKFGRSVALRLLRRKRISGGPLADGSGRS